MDKLKTITQDIYHKNTNRSSLYQHKGPPQVTATSWILIDHKSKVIHGKNYNQIHEIASLTKIMTTYTAYKLTQQLSIPFDVNVPVPNGAIKIGGTSANLEENQFVSLENLFYGTMLPSGNDAAYALGNILGWALRKHQKATQYPRSLSTHGRKKDLVFYLNQGNWKNEIDNDLKGNQEILNEEVNQACFVKQMNNDSHILQLRQSQFVNCHGLTQNQSKYRFIGQHLYCV